MSDKKSDGDKGAEELKDTDLKDVSGGLAIPTGGIGGLAPSSLGARCGEKEQCNA